MPFAYTMSSSGSGSVTSTGSAGSITLYHGSALVYCNAIATSGLNYEQLKLACVGAYAFCASISPERAKGYAFLNPLVVMEGHQAAVVEFKLSPETLAYCQSKKQAAWIGGSDLAYEFYEGSFPRINLERTGVSVQIVTEKTMTFDQ